MSLLIGAFVFVDIAFLMMTKPVLVWLVFVQRKEKVVLRKEVMF